MDYFSTAEQRSAILINVATQTSFGAMRLLHGASVSSGLILHRPFLEGQDFAHIRRRIAVLHLKP